MASLSANLAISGNVVPNQPISATLTLYNPSAATINVVGSPTPFATSNGNPWAGVNFGQVTSIGNAKAIPSGGTLTYSFGFVLFGPQGSAENNAAQANAATTAILLGVSVVTDDNNVISPSVTLTPAQQGPTTPTAGVPAPGVFNFGQPANSCNYFLY